MQRLVTHWSLLLQPLMWNNWRPLIILWFFHTKSPFSPFPPDFSHLLGIMSKPPPSIISAHRSTCHFLNVSFPLLKLLKDLLKLKWKKFWFKKIWKYWLQLTEQTAWDFLEAKAIQYFLQGTVHSYIIIISIHSFISRLEVIKICSKFLQFNNQKPKYVWEWCKVPH